MPFVSPSLPLEPVRLPVHQPGAAAAGGAAQPGPLLAPGHVQLPPLQPAHLLSPESVSRCEPLIIAMLCSDVH